MIGRKMEMQILNEVYHSGKAELVAIYGRRRVGKTFLVDHFFHDRIAFRHAGLSPIEMETMNEESPMRIQLRHFHNSLIEQGMESSQVPKDWLDAFLMLEIFLKSKDNGGRMIVFIDELPWLDTPRSYFVTAFEGFWNSWACHRDNIMVVVCGSSTTWILDKLINNHGGLYGRVTRQIKLSPFTLHECEEYFRDRQIKMTRYDITCTYMILGGIPFYLDCITRGSTLANSIDRMFFTSNAILVNEYDRLFSSTFTNPDMMKSIIRILSKTNAGLTKGEISKVSRYSSGGTLTKALEALIANDFVIRYVPFGYTKKHVCYKLVDPFCMFCLKFVEGNNSLVNSFWNTHSSSQSVAAWRDFAFENVCFNHIKQIKSALEIGGVTTKQSIWSKRADDKTGAQIDMIIERNNNIVNSCEMKFYKNEFEVTKEYYRVLVNRQMLLENSLQKKMAVHNTLITAEGLAYNEYSSFFNNVITLDDLFCK